jgi:large subunit ribosomal protein L10
MRKDEKERVVAELTDRLRSAETLIVADYRGLTMPQIDELRSRLLEHGARFSVVKNTLGRRAAEAAGVDALLALLEGPTAVAFLETGGDPIAVAKALGDAARTTRVIEVRGGVLQGRPITREDVEALAVLPPVDVLRGQVLGAVTAPLYTIVGLFTAPLHNLVGLIDARIEQLREQGDAGPASEAAAPAEGASGTEPQAPADAMVGAAAPAEGASGTEPQASADAAAGDDDTPPEPTDMAPAGEEQAEAPGSAEDPQTPSASATESVEAATEGTASETE